MKNNRLNLVEMHIDDINIALTIKGIQDFQDCVFKRENLSIQYDGSEHGKTLCIRVLNLDRLNNSNIIVNNEVMNLAEYIKIAMSIGDVTSGFGVTVIGYMVLQGLSMEICVYNINKLIEIDFNVLDELEGYEWEVSSYRKNSHR